MEPNGAPKKPALRITSADNQPIEIEAGAYYVNTKARCQRVMRESLSPEAHRVHACLELATMGFHQELAVKLDRGRKVPLTPDDVSQQTGLTRQNTRRAIVELENAGLAERRAADGGTLRRGQILIYSWALPRKPEKVCSQRATTNYPDFPTDFSLLVAVSKRLKINLDFSDVNTCKLIVENGGETVARDYKQAARDYKQAEDVVARFLKSVSAQTTNASAYRKERKGKIVTPKDTPPPPSSSPAASVVAAVKAEEEEVRPGSFETFQNLYPPGRLDQAKAKPLFDRLTPADQQAAISWLKRNRGCPRWVASNGRWVPFASNFLGKLQFHHPPPPAFDTAAPTSETPVPNGVSKLQQKAQEFARRVQEERRLKEQGKPRGS